MKNIIIRIIISIVVILVISACSKEEESTTIPFTTTCTGSSSGSGPTIGGVTLKEATYKEGSTSFMFVNSTSANVVISGGDSYCYTIDATSTTATMQKMNSSGTGVDNVTAYYTTMKQGTWTDTPTTFHMYIYADTDSSFYLNGWGYGSKSTADAVYVLSKLYTEQ
jgi:uncharacterized lipoprotein YehR (DUF1307 family)